MNFFYLFLGLLFLHPTFADNSPQFVEDKFEQFEVHWSIALILNKSNKKQTIYLDASDLQGKDKSISKFSDPSSKRSCEFKRSATPNVLTPNEWFQVVGNLKCDFSGIKYMFNPITCEFKTSDKKEMSDSSSVRIKNGDEDLYFIYGCNVILKK